MDWSERQRYMATPAWQAKRQECFTYWKWSCAVCGQDWRRAREAGEKRWLECHHLHYKTLGKEDIAKDLRPLCNKHHRKGRYNACNDP